MGEEIPDHSLASRGKHTGKNGPWALIGTESFGSRSAAMRRVRQLKSYKSAQMLRELFQAQR